MWLDIPIIKNDLINFCNCNYIPWDKMRNKTVLITGATGLIGASLINALVYANKNRNLSIKVIALVRDCKYANERFKEQLNYDDCINLVEGTMEQLPVIGEDVDYIIHCANPTSSKFFVNYPVETIMTTVMGTFNLLELAKIKEAESFVFLSSMEVYGTPKNDNPICECSGTNINTMAVRSSYPESKRMCENLCASYCSEFSVPAKVVRLSQTFGPGIQADDNRVFAYFANCAVKKQDIVLNTKGESKRCYLYTMDAVSAILTVLLKGESGVAYNVANPDTYCSVYEMANIVAQRFGENFVKVVVSLENASEFSPLHCLNLNIDRIQKLGWRPTKNLVEMYYNMINTM